MRVRGGVSKASIHRTSSLKVAAAWGWWRAWWKFPGFEVFFFDLNSCISFPSDLHLCGARRVFRDVVLLSPTLKIPFGGQLFSSVGGAEVFLFSRRIGSHLVGGGFRFFVSAVD